MSLVHWRAFIGPPYLTTDNEYHWDWSTLAVGDVVDFYDLQTTLRSRVSADSTSIHMNFDSFGGPAGAWIGGTGAGGEGWEYVLYKNSGGYYLRDIRRENLTEHSGTHPNGSSVRWWYPLEVTDGNFSFTAEYDDNLAVSSWRASLSGMLFPQGALRNGHCIVIQMREAVDDAWRVFLVGFLDSPRVSDDYKRESKWSASILSGFNMAGKQRLRGLRVGELNVAPHCTLSSSTTLIDFTQERHTGDIIEDAPDLKPANLVDEDDTTLWISQVYLGSSRVFPYIVPQRKYAIEFTKLHLQPNPAKKTQYRWMEFFVHRTVQAMDFETRNSNGDLVIEHRSISGFFQAGQLIVITDNETAFKADHPDRQIDRTMKISSWWFDALVLPDGGFALWETHQMGDNWHGGVKWGNTDDRFWNGDKRDSKRMADGLQHMGSVGAPGQTAQKDIGTQTWTTSWIDTGGYFINSSGIDSPWVMIEFPVMGLMIAEDIDTEYPTTGEILQTMDAGDRSTGGLAESGIIQVGDEQMSYHQKVDGGISLTARGVNGTTVAPHVAGDTIYIYESGSHTEAIPIKKVTFGRDHANHPTAYRVFVNSGLESKSPGDKNWDEDGWIHHPAMTGIAERHVTVSINQRVRKMVIKIDGMVDDPSRAKLDLLEAVIDESYYNKDGALINDETSGEIVLQLIKDSGFPEEAVTIGSDLPSVTGFISAAEEAGTVIPDMIDFTGLQMINRRDSHLLIDKNNFWSENLTPVRTWTRNNATRCEHVWGNNSPTGQIQLEWVSPDGTHKAMAVYPNKALDGKVEKIGPIVYTGAEAALVAARRRFYMARYPYTILVECVNLAKDVEPGEIHRVTWDFDSEMPAIDRLFMVQSVDHRVERMNGVTTLNMVQVDRVGS